MKYKVITMNVSAVGFETALNTSLSWAESRMSSYICVSNVHMCMETYKNLHFREVVNNADLTVPDGRPIYWALRLMGIKGASQIRGQDLMDKLCRDCANKGINIGLYGGFDDEVLEKVKSNLNMKYPNLKISYAFSPPFRELSDVELDCVIRDVNISEVGVLFVGIGCPKQEQWMYMQKGKINSVMLGVGAAFDFISGEKRHAPSILSRLGLEWLFRLLCEPKRLWKRYLVNNPMFIYLLIKQLINKS